MDVCVKEEVSETPTVTQRKPRTGAVSVPPPDSVIELSSSDSDSESDIDLDDVVASALQDGGSPSKKPKTDSGAVLPVGFLSPLPPAPASPPASLLALPAPEWASISASLSKDYSGPGVNSCKQFWKAGDYDGAVCGGSGSSTGVFYFCLSYMELFFFIFVYLIGNCFLCLYILYGTVTYCLFWELLCFRLFYVLFSCFLAFNL